MGRECSFTPPRGKEGSRVPPPPVQQQGVWTSNTLGVPNMSFVKKTQLSQHKRSDLIFTLFTGVNLILPSVIDFSLCLFSFIFVFLRLQFFLSAFP